MIVLLSMFAEIIVVLFSPGVTVIPVPAVTMPYFAVSAPDDDTERVLVS